MKNYRLCYEYSQINYVVVIVSQFLHDFRCFMVLWVDFFLSLHPLSIPFPRLSLTWGTDSSLCLLLFFTQWSAALLLPTNECIFFFYYYHDFYFFLFESTKRGSETTFSHFFEGVNRVLDTWTSIRMSEILSFFHSLLSFSQRNKQSFLSYFRSIFFSLLKLRAMRDSHRHKFSISWYVCVWKFIFDSNPIKTTRQKEHRDANKFWDEDVFFSSPRLILNLQIFIIRWCDDD